LFYKIAMEFPRKGSRALNHRDTHYRWIIRNKAGKNELIISLSSVVNGQLFVGEVPRITNLEIAPLAIDNARQLGWVPEKAGEPFRCRYVKGQFVLLDGA
jgi:hypothetical protein